jgi:hypothetical protein
MEISPAVPAILPTTSRLTFANRWDHFLARWGVYRSAHRLTPGLYALGHPTPAARVFVSANYTLSFDALRAALDGLDAYILVLDTQGINVWCAAGKGTFGTDELVQRITATGLSQVVSHRKLILPQLGAPGVSAHEVKQRSGFAVEYGPVRAADLRAYLQTEEVSSEMRRVNFPLRDRFVLIPVELIGALIPLVILLLLRYWPGVSAILAGTVLFPILLPWLPTHNFSTKGFILGGLLGLPFALIALLGSPQVAWWLRAGWALSDLLVMTSVTAFVALNFTGSTPFTSRSGVRKEIFTYAPAMAWMFGAGLLLTAASILLKRFGV